MTVRRALLVTLLAAAAPASAGDTAPPADADVALAVESRLLRADGIRAHRVDVSVREGVVTLAGVVDSLRAKERAVDLAATRQGVRAIVDRVAVEPAPSVDDAALAEAVEAALAYDPATESYEIDVTADDGRVVLSGVVDGHAEAALAADVAAGVRGARAVDASEVDVEGDLARTDQDIEGDVARWLEASPWIDDDRIRVEVTDAEVHLSGTVGSLAERRWAEERAWVAGVKAVDADDLAVEWGAGDPDLREERRARLTDDAVAAAVRDALAVDPRVAAYEPDVVVYEGIVTLTGAVDDLLAKEAAGAAARNTLGAWRVKNFLRVEPDVPRGDDAIAAQIRAAFERDPDLVHEEDLAVAVRRGRVELYGATETAAGRARAERLAAAADGVRSVENRIIARRDRPLERDWALRAEVLDELRWSAFVDDEQVGVEVADGVVTLRGRVDTWRQYAAAEGNARDAGAAAVRNQLAVDEPRPAER